MELEPEFQKIKEWVDAPKTGVINPIRMAQVTDSLEIIKRIILATDPDASIMLAEVALQTGAMAISVTTTDVTVHNTAEFAEAVKYADNFQVYPTTDDRVKLDILFGGVIKYTLDN